MLCVGVLALQGDFSKHIAMLHSLGINTREVRRSEDLSECDGLIIPGGESTVMLRQIDFIHMRQALHDFAQNKPIFGTCAGLILMASHVQSFPLKPLKILNISVERNAFGRQAESFQTPVSLEFQTNQHNDPFPAFFIRAPRIRSYQNVQILATFKEEPILIQQGWHLGASFHPELTSDPAVHHYFLELIRQSQLKLKEIVDQSATYPLKDNEIDRASD